MVMIWSAAEWNELKEAMNVEQVPDVVLVNCVRRLVHEAAYAATTGEQNMKASFVDIKPWWKLW